MRSSAPFIKSRPAGCKKSRSFEPALAALLALVVVISGCTMVGPDYVKPTAPEPSDWLGTENAEFKSSEADLTQWWSVFNDPVLTRLVESAYRQNLPLQVAGVRILEARAQLGIAFGFQYPQQQQAGASASVNQVSRYAPNAAMSDRYFFDYQTSLDAVWELDFWGKFRRAVQAGVANLEATIADYDNILVSLTAEVASTYVALRTAEERFRVTQENIKLQQRSLEIAQVRFDAGAVTELDVVQARALLRGTEATLPPLERTVRQAKNALAILLGKLPGEIDAMLEGEGRIPKVPAEVAVGIPTELLRRRPDIRSAERQLAAQSAQIGVAKAELFPAFSLFGTIGFQTADKTGVQSNNADIGDWFKSKSFTYSAGPAVQWNILNYGQITNQVRVEDAVFQELAINYENTVLTAVQEVEDAMVSFLKTQQTVELLADAVQALKRSVELSMIQYREGLVDYQRVIDTQRDLVGQEDNLVATTGDVDLSLVSMYKALGGGWEIRKNNDFVPKDIQQQMAQRTNWDELLSPDALQYPPSEEVRAVFHKPDW